MRRARARLRTLGWWRESLSLHAVGPLPPPLLRSLSFCIELPSQETVLDARATSCLGVLNGCTTGPAVAMRRVPWGSWWPRQEMLRMREDRRLKEELPGFQELAGEMGQGQGQSHGSAPWRGPKLCLPVRLTLRLDSASGIYSKGFQPGSDLCDPQTAWPTHLLLPPTMGSGGPSPG